MGTALGSPADDDSAAYVEMVVIQCHGTHQYYSAFDELYKESYLLPDLQDRAVTDCVTWTAQHGRSQDYTLLRRREPVRSYSVPCIESE